jgi:hypothetical protein
MAEEKSIEETRKDMMRWIANAADNLSTLARMEAAHVVLMGEVKRLQRRLDLLQTLEGSDAEAADAAKKKYWADEGHREANKTQAEWGIAILKKRGQKKAWWIRWWR